MKAWLLLADDGRQRPARRRLALADRKGGVEGRLKVRFTDPPGFDLQAA